MRRHWLARFLSGCLAVWFTLSVGEPSFARICPMHDSATASQDDMDGMPGMAPASGSDAQHHTSRDHSRSPGSHAHHCSCIACCVGADHAGMAAATVGFSTDATTPGVQSILADATTLPRSAAAHTLPPGTGPPRL